MDRLIDVSSKRLAEVNSYEVNLRSFEYTKSAFNYLMMTYLLPDRQLKIIPLPLNN